MAAPPPSIPEAEILHPAPEEVWFLSLQWRQDKPVAHPE